MIILGVADGPDASAALVVGGELVAAVTQERIDRERHSRAFPSAAIDAVLDTAGLRAREIDRVVFGTSFSPSTFLRARPDLRARVTPRLREAFRGYQAALRATGLYTVEQDVSRKLLLPKVRELGFEKAAVELVEHDRAHATAAYRCQDHDEALVVTIDSPGDGAAVTVSVGRHLQLARVFLQTALASIATFPERVARALGIEPGDLWALAAWGTPRRELRDVFRKEVGLSGDGFTNRAFVPHPDPLAGRVSAFTPEDVAAAAQEAIEEAVLGFVRLWVERTRIEHLVLAGDVVANPRLVGRLAADAGVRTVTVFAAPGDEGLSIGAALGLSGAPARALPALDLGPRYTEVHCYKALSNASLPRVKVDDPDARAAALLAAGRTVARFAGGVEIGPASAGNRAVLFRADDAEVRARALSALRRPEWAPVTCLVPDDVLGTFPDAPRLAGNAPAPLAAVPAPSAFAASHRGVVHRDGRVLPRRVDPGDPLRGLLDAASRATGRAAVGMVDLRMDEQPLACSPSDAVRAWRDSEVDALLLGPYLVERSAVPT